jgi:subtilisin family serine protease
MARGIRNSRGSGRSSRSESDGGSPPSSAPRLGLVVRFAPGASGAGVKQLESGGFKVATSSDFKSSLAVPNNFGGADVQYFERLGIAVVRSQGEKVSALMEMARAGGTVHNARPELRYRPLGTRISPTDIQTGLRTGAEPSASLGSFDPTYLRGYRDGVNDLIDRLLTSSQISEIRSQAGFQDGTMTWGLQAIRVPSTTLSGKGIRVAVLDTGLDDSHPDFAGRNITKKLFATQSVEGDIHGHGTHCIGTACGSRSPANAPRYGVAPEAEIFAGKVLGDDGFGTDRSIIAGIDWALANRCEVISMSLGAATTVGTVPNEDYEQIGEVCLDAGTLIIAAAGNESMRPSHIAPVSSPANATSIMAVAAVDRDLRIASFSCGARNPGQDVDIAGPGVEVLSSVPGGGYAKFQGTSMATPHVAGIAALLAQSDQTLRGRALWERLIQTCRALPLPPRDVGRGLVQI